MEKLNKNLRLIRILNDDHEQKFIAIEGEVGTTEGEKQSAVLLLHKNAFRFDDVVKLMSNNDEQLKEDFVNDVYHKYTLEARSACNDISLTFIYPATPLHIKKYLKKDFSLITETYQQFQSIVRPYIEQNQLSSQWIYNILDGKAEQERILFETNEFIVLPSMGWDEKTIDSICVFTLVKTRDIHSIRDLKPEHIPMLESMLEKTTTFLSTKYGIRRQNIRAFFLYPSTSYHLHVRFTTLPNHGYGCEVEQAHLMQDVIDHLKLMPDYYQTKTLYYKVAIDDPLYKLLGKDEHTNST